MFRVDFGLEIFFDCRERDPRIGSPFGVKEVILRGVIVFYALCGYERDLNKKRGKVVGYYRGAVGNVPQEVALEKKSPRLFFGFSGGCLRWTFSVVRFAAKRRPASMRHFAGVIGQQQVYFASGFEIQRGPCRVFGMAGRAKRE